MSPSPCQRMLLAQTPGAEVTRCSCGHIHVSLGPVTIRMDAETLHAAWHTMGEALRSLSHSSMRESPQGARTGREWEQ